jgi:hypothetical protein
MIAIRGAVTGERAQSAVERTATMRLMKLRHLAARRFRI